MIRRMIGSPATGIAGFARTRVNGRRRVPSPAVSTSACEKGTRCCQRPANTMSPAGRSAFLAEADEQRAIRIDDVVGRAAAERIDGRDDAAVAAFDLDERADRCFVDRDDHLVERELLAVFLVAEPDAKSRSQRIVTRRSPSSTAVSSSSRSLSVGCSAGLLNVTKLCPASIRTRRTWPRALSARSSVSNSASDCSRRGLSGAGAGGSDGRAGGFGRFKPQFDFAFERRRHAPSVYSGPQGNG